MVTSSHFLGGFAIMGFNYSEATLGPKITSALEITEMEREGLVPQQHAWLGSTRIEALADLLPVTQHGDSFEMRREVLMHERRRERRHQGESEGEGESEAIALARGDKERSESRAKTRRDAQARALLGQGQEERQANEKESSHLHRQLRFLIVVSEDVLP